LGAPRARAGLPLRARGRATSSARIRAHPRPPREQQRPIENHFRLLRLGLPRITRKGADQDWWLRPQTGSVVFGSRLSVLVLRFQNPSLLNSPSSGLRFQVSAFSPSRRGKPSPTSTSCSTVSRRGPLAGARPSAISKPGVARDRISSANERMAVGGSGVILTERPDASRAI